MTDWLIDKSTLVRLGNATDGQTWAERIERGLVRVSTVTRLEIEYSARTGDELRGRSAAATAGLHARGVPDASHRGPRRRGPAVARRPWTSPAPAVPDILIAATVELAGLAVPHHDEDFDIIAELTGQQLERLQLDE